MNLVEFIDQIFIKEINQIQNEHGQHKYLSFGLISQGIEFLGSLTDKEKFNMDTSAESANRFNKALKEFFDAHYHTYTAKNNDYYLYKNLRCGMLHIVVPKNKIALGEREKDKDKYEHLKVYDFDDGARKLFLMAETFYEDFKKACETAKVIIKDKSIFTKYPDLNNASVTKKQIVELTRDFLNTSVSLK